MKINLNIEMDHPDELRPTLLALLKGAGGVSVNVSNVEVKGDDPDRAVQKIVDAAAKEPTKAKAKKVDDKPAEQPKAEEQKAAAPEPKKEEPKPETPKNGHAGKKVEAKKEEPKADQPPAGAGTPLSIELPDEIKNTNSMRDLLNYLAEHGVKDPDTMAATCAALKPQVPILTKVPDVDTRVRRAVEVLGLFQS